jgi:flagellar hook-basal body complex protein FliE
MILPVTALGSEWNLGGIGGLGSAAQVAPATDAVPTGSGSFGNVLTDAINSLDQTQTVADSAAQGLATGTLTDPTQAVTAVENASLDMDFASQITNKVVTDANTIFQTQM